MRTIITVLAAALTVTATLRAQERRIAGLPESRIDELSLKEDVDAILRAAQ